MKPVAQSLARFVERNLPEDPASRRPVINVIQQMGAANSASTSADAGNEERKEGDAAAPSAPAPNLVLRVREGIKRVTLRLVLVGAILFVAVVVWWWGKLIN